MASASELVATLSGWSGDPTVRAVVITGSGGSFCAGADLRSNESPPDRPDGAPERIGGDLVRRQKLSAQSLIAAILDCEKPVIAALNGVAAGMGVHVALACDFVVAARGARLMEVFVSRGLVPDAGGAYLLTRLVGLQKVKEILLLGDALSADQALELGLVNSVVNEGELEETVGACWPSGWPRARPAPLPLPNGWSTGRSMPIAPRASKTKRWRWR